MYVKSQCDIKNFLDIGNQNKGTYMTLSKFSDGGFSENI